ncbi:MAG TPA: hypothetical protein VFP89_02320 [Propionibacteriaceae bacterium]|nr:hypothetical protein [Propionibacteriaceae bacterium]
MKFSKVTLLPRGSAGGFVAAFGLGCPVFEARLLGDDAGGADVAVPVTLGAGLGPVPAGSAPPLQEATNGAHIRQSRAACMRIRVMELDASTRSAAG